MRFVSVHLNDEREKVQRKSASGCGTFYWQPLFCVFVPRSQNELRFCHIDECAHNLEVISSHFSIIQKSV